jgi:peptidoglycan/xylan/chitin deacetylase (PgdA/CDA1 family)
MLPVLATGLAGAAAFFSLGTYGATRPASTMWGPVISRGPGASGGAPAAGSVALTFDDGPLPGATDRILDALGEAGVSAAFFVIGRCVERWPDLVRRMHAEGHLVANHSYDHHPFGLVGRYHYWLEEIRRADDVIEDVVGVRPAMFRPPMGLKHWHLMNAAADLGHRVVTWSQRAMDSRPMAAESVVGRLVGPARAGDVMLLHDGSNPHLKPQGRAGTVGAVRPLIDGLRRRGLTPVRPDALLGIPAYRERAARMPAPVPA